MAIFDNDHSVTTQPEEVRGFAFGLSEAAVAQLQAILSKEEARAVSRVEAWQRAIELLALFRMLLGPLPDDSSGSNIVAIDDSSDLSP